MTNHDRKRAEAASVRSNLVDRVRQDIAEGRCDTPGRLDKAMDSLIDDAMPASAIFTTSTPNQGTR